MLVKLAHHETCKTEHLVYIYTVRGDRAACFTNDFQEAKAFSRKHARFGKPLPIFNRATRGYVGD